MRILLVDPADEVRNALQAGLASTAKGAHTVAQFRPRTAKKKLIEVASASDILIFGLRATEHTVVHIASLLRHEGMSLPVFAVTREFEMGVPTNYKKAGVDEMLNFAELRTPLISWTFESALKQSEVRKKATEFDHISCRLSGMLKNLAFITHEVTNSLSVMRLAMYHLQNYEGTVRRREMLSKLIGDNIDRIQSHIEDLRKVRHDLEFGKNGTPAKPIVRAVPGNMDEAFLPKRSGE